MWQLRIGRVHATQPKNSMHSYLQNGHYQCEHTSELDEQQQERHNQRAPHGSHLWIACVPIQYTVLPAFSESLMRAATVLVVIAVLSRIEFLSPPGRFSMLPNAILSSTRTCLNSCLLNI